MIPSITYVDVISDVLTATRVEGAVFARLDGSEPWDSGAECAKKVCFGRVARGRWTVTSEGLETLFLEGDFFLLGPDEQRSIRFDIANPATIVGGHFAFNERDIPLLELLPSVVHIPAGKAQTAALQNTLELLESETAMQQPGSQLVINRLADIFFIHAVRAFLASDESSKTARLRALADHQIGAAIKAMHQQMDQRWTVTALALIAGMSRSAFASRFKELMGLGPLEYLTQWRMNHAARLLEENGGKLFEVANSVGYDSDGAFHKAFKRVIGVTPGEYRRNHRSLAAGAA